MPTYDLVQQYGRANRSLPSAVGESDLTPIRTSRYGEQHVRVQDRVACAMEGTFFSAKNATPGTAITMQASVQAYAATTPSIIVTNLSSASEDKLLVLDYIRIMALTVPGGSGTQRYDARIDNIARYSSGGTVLTPTNQNINSSNATSSRVYVGALTAAAASSSERLCAAGIARNGVGLAGDYFHFDFMGRDAGGNFLEPATTVGANRVIPMPPVVLGASQSFLLNWWGASLTTAATWEFDIGFVER